MEAMGRLSRQAAILVSAVGVSAAVGLGVLAAELEHVGNGGLGVACVLGAVGVAECSGWLLAWLTK
mgnify:CR=1 FL=1